MSASFGWITTRLPDVNTCGRTWRVTPEGLTLLFEIAPKETIE